MKKIGYNTPKTIAQTLLTEVIFEIAKFAKYTFMVGTYATYFTASSVIGPLFGTSTISLAIFSCLVLIRAVLSNLVWHAPVTLLLSYHIPLIFAALFFGKRSLKTVVAFFLICMVVFMANPVGGQSWIYGLLWIIPIIARLLSNNLISRALCSTFAAHAVGSIIFAYTLPSTPTMWVGLIPVVLLERFTLASCIIGVSMVYSWVWERVETRIFTVNPS